MYKIYLENDSMILTTLTEVRELTEATPEQVRKIFTSRCCEVNGFEIINLSKELK
jgi:hypothetical protein